MMDLESQMRNFESVSRSILDMLNSGVLLTGPQEKTLGDTIRDLRLGYGEWLRNTPQKLQHLR
jgi:hypothetical protein